MSNKNVTLIADEKLIELARQKAKANHLSLNQIFGNWLKQYVGKKVNKQDYRNFMKSLSYADAGQSFSRDERNER